MPDCGMLIERRNFKMAIAGKDGGGSRNSATKYDIIPSRSVRNIFVNDYANS